LPRRVPKRRLVGRSVIVDCSKREILLSRTGNYLSTNMHSWPSPPEHLRPPCSGLRESELGRGIEHNLGMKFRLLVVLYIFTVHLICMVVWYTMLGSPHAFALPFWLCRASINSLQKVPEPGPRSICTSIAMQARAAGQS
jgi:hypothetical protein